MTDGNNNDSGKLKLNLGAKEFKPKTFTTNTNQNINQIPNQFGSQPYNPMMQNGYYMMNNTNNYQGQFQQNQGISQPSYQTTNMQGGVQLNTMTNNMNNLNLNNTNTVTTTKTNSNQNLNKQTNNNQVKKDEKPKKPEQPKKTEEKKPQQQSNKINDNKKDNVKAKVENKKEEVELVNDADELENVVSKEGKMVEVDETRDPASIIFIGHVDHGKSTVCGNILVLTGQVDQRTIEKYKAEAIKNKREGWYLAYIMDLNEDEREKGKTVEIGKAYFSLEKKKFTILDGPGHAGFLPNLLLGACQADFACLIISAKEGEYEAGFEKSGSTKEHALLAKSLGVNKLVIAVNKMDEESVNWSEKRFNSIRNSLFDYLKKIGYKEDDVHLVPISGLFGDGIKERIDPVKAPWYTGGTLFEVLDNLPVCNRNAKGPLRFSVLDRYKESGMQVMGKVESGTIKYGNTYTLMPSKIPIEVQWIFNSEDNGIPFAKDGESVRVSKIN